MPLLLSQLQIRSITPMIDDNHELKLKLVTQFMNNANVNHQFAGHTIAQSQIISMAQFNRLRLVNHLAPVSNQYVQQAVRLKTQLSGTLQFKAMVNTDAQQIDWHTVQSLLKPNRQSDSGPDKEIPVPMRQLQSSAAVSLAAENVFTRQAIQTQHSLSLNSVTSIANSIAHSPEHLSSRQQAKLAQAQTAIKTTGTFEEKHAAKKLNNTKQTLAVQKELLDLGQKAIGRQKAIETDVQHDHQFEPHLER